MIHCYIISSLSNCVVVLASAAFALKLTICVPHKKPLFAVLFGQEPTLPLDLVMIKLSNCTVKAVSDFLSS